MAAPVWSVGQVLTASDVNTWFVPLAAVKTADQSVTGSVGTLFNDNTLVVPVAANAHYYMDLVLFNTGGTLGSTDIRYGFTVPAGASIGFQWLITNISNATQAGFGPAGGGYVLSATNGATVITTTMWGYLTTAGAAGNLQLQWCQDAGSATATAVKAGSVLKLTRTG